MKHIIREEQYFDRNCFYLKASMQCYPISNLNLNSFLKYVKEFRAKCSPESCCNFMSSHFLFFGLRMNSGQFHKCLTMPTLDLNAPSWHLKHKFYCHFKIPLFGNITDKYTVKTQLSDSEQELNFSYN